MANGRDVLEMLCPDKEWVIYGDEYDSIQWIKGEPISREEFNAGFAQYDAWKAQQEAETEAKRVSALSKLAALGINENDLKALGL